VIGKATYRKGRKADEEGWRKFRLSQNLTSSNDPAARVDIPEVRLYPDGVEAITNVRSGGWQERFVGQLKDEKRTH
jgi:hypothetical protein